MPLVANSDGSGNAGSNNTRTLKRPLGLGAGVIGAPTVVYLVDPTVGLILVICELATFMIVLVTALFGTSTLSDRAFRLLRWVADRPEYAAPPTTLGTAPQANKAPEPQEPALFTDHSQTGRRTGHQ
jgi:hypothetical protein